MQEIALPKEVFVTGTDTDVGKTMVSAMLMQAHHASYWKPVQTGTVDGYDRKTIQSTTQLHDDRFYPETYCFEAPLSPHVASEMEGVTIDMNAFQKPVTRNHLIIEGAGGVFCPLNRSELMIDLIEKLNIPTIIVARSTLGTINHTVMTIQCLQIRHIPILGVIVNGPSNPGNCEAIAHYGKIPILAEIPLQEVFPCQPIQTHASGPPLHK